MNKKAPQSEAKPQRLKRSKRSSPKVLFAFANAKIVGIYKCSCNCVHYGISEQDALVYVASTNAYLSSLDDMELRVSSGARSISVERFRRCFFCSAEVSEMTAISQDEEHYSVSHQPVIVDAVQDIVA